MKIQQAINTGVQGAKHLAEGVGHTVEDVAHQVGDRVEHLSAGAKAGILTLTTAGLVNAPAFADGVQQAAPTYPLYADSWSPLVEKLVFFGVTVGLPLLVCGVLAIADRIGHGGKQMVENNNTNQ